MNGTTVNLAVVLLLGILVLASPVARCTIPILGLVIRAVLQGQFKRAWAIWRVWAIFVSLSPDRQRATIERMEGRR